MALAILQAPRFAKLFDLGQSLKSLFAKEHVPHWTEYLRDDLRK